MTEERCFSEGLESTAVLVDRIRDGDLEAREEFARLYIPLLRRWAHGRLPSSARSLAETDDLVQTTLMKSLDRVKELKLERAGSMLAYLRTVLLNAVRREIRRPQHRSPRLSLEGAEAAVAAEVSPHGDEDIGLFLDYERALNSLKPETREAVILRLEFGLSYAEIAAALEKSSADAARMLVSRALLKLAEEMS